MHDHRLVTNLIPSNSDIQKKCMSFYTFKENKFKREEIERLMLPSHVIRILLRRTAKY
jgi:hypothetical protein